MAEKPILPAPLRPPDLVTHRGRAWNVDLVNEINKESRSQNPNLACLWLLESLDMDFSLPYSKLEIREIPAIDRGHDVQNFNFRLASLEQGSPVELRNLMEAPEYRLIAGGNFYCKNMLVAQALGASAMICFTEGKLEPHDRDHQSWSHHFNGS
jgi:hypothetical protein